MFYNIYKCLQVGDIVFGLGLTMTIIIYVFFALSIITYFVFVLKKKYNICDFIDKIVFFHGLFALMIESWALIIMNDGFNVNFNIEIKFSMYISIAFIVPLIAIVAYSNIMYRKNYKIEMNKVDKVGNYMVLPLTIFSLMASTLILFFNINYYIYYNVIP